MDPLAAPTAAPTADRALHAPSGGPPELPSLFGHGQFVDSVRVIITALLFAFVFRAFFVEPFIIPTGSMAPTLLGDHWTFRCPICGFEFDSDQLKGPVADSAQRIVCGNCRNWVPAAEAAPAWKRGDRILVHKWPYGVMPPARWDVMVFRDPARPDQNYIKRLVGLPGEVVEIVDGDLHIDGRIVRKPAHVQRALWQPVWRQLHAPDPQRDVVLRWIEAREANGLAHWSGVDGPVLRCTPPDGASATLLFLPDLNDYYRDFSAYNGESDFNSVADMRIAGEVWFGAAQGRVRFEWVFSGDAYSLVLDADGTWRMERRRLMDEAAHTLEQGRFSVRGGVAAFEFGQLDQQIYARINQVRVYASADGVFGVPDPEARRLVAAPTVELRLEAAGGECALRGIQIDRDVYYTASRRARRAVNGQPFTLRGDEYFVLGDNSAESHDAREWVDVGPGVPDDYRLGTVRGAQIVGKAAFVYLPGRLGNGPGQGWPMLDIGRVRFIR